MESKSAYINRRKDHTVENALSKKKNAYSPWKRNLCKWLDSCALIVHTCTMSGVGCTCKCTIKVLSRFLCFDEINHLFAALFLKSVSGYSSSLSNKNAWKIIWFCLRVFHIPNSANIVKRQCTIQKWFRIWVILGLKSTVFFPLGIIPRQSCF